MSIRSFFPSISPTLTLDFAKSKSLGPNVGFSRSQTGNISSYTGSDGLIKYAGPDEPRFDHRVTKRTNLIKYSQEIDFALPWAGSNGSTITADAVIAPDGSQTAEEIYISSWILQTYGDAKPSTTYTFSVWLKSPGDTQSVPIWFEESDKIAETTVTVTNEWQRFSLTATSSSSPINFRPSVRGPRTLYVWGAQLEEGSEPTEYIATDSHYTTRTKVESVGLLIETGRTNIHHVNHQNLRGSGTGNGDRFHYDTNSSDVIAPDGSNSTFKAYVDGTETNPGGSLYIINNSYTTYNTTNTHTSSVFIKPASETLFRFDAHPNYASATSGGTATGITFQFDLSSPQGEVISIESGGISANVTPYANGWYRCSWTYHRNSTNPATSAYAVIIYPQTWWNANAGGNGTICYVWGPQVEDGAFATSYIPTSGSTVTRSSESLWMTGSKNFSSFYNPTQWTLLVDQSISKQTLNSSPASVQAYTFDDQTTDNQYMLRFVSSTTNPYIDTYGKTNNTTVLDLPGDSTLWTNETVDLPLRTAFTCNQTTTKFCNNSGPTQIDGVFSLSSGVNRFVINSKRKSNISKISYYPAALPSTQLQTLTTPKV